jgi:hypothetical protein
MLAGVNKYFCEVNHICFLFQIFCLSVFFYNSVVELEEIREKDVSSKL